MRPTAFLGLLLLGLLVSGCQSRGVWLANGVRYQLQPPGALGQELLVVQKISATYRDQQVAFMTQVEATPASFVLASMGAGGPRAFLLRDDGVKLAYEQHPLFKAPIRPAYLLADFQAIFWPAPALHAGLRGGELRESPGQREILRNGQPAIRIRYDGADPWAGLVTYEHLQRGYRFVIRSQSQD